MRTNLCNAVISTAKINQNITSEASKLLPCSSNAPVSAPGANHATTPQARKNEMCPATKWYYMYLGNRELRQYVDIFTGKEPLVKYGTSGKTQKTLDLKVFTYTSADHKKRIENCNYTPAEYEKRKRAAQSVQDAFDDTRPGSKLNENINAKAISGGGYLFINGRLPEIEQALACLTPRRYLTPDYKTHNPATIADQEMKEFLYLYESMPWNIQLMQRPIEDYIARKQNIVITGGVLKGKHACIMRLHRNSRIVLAIGNMTVAVADFHAFPFERV